MNNNDKANLSKSLDNIHAALNLQWRVLEDEIYDLHDEKNPLSSELRIIQNFVGAAMSRLEEMDL